MSETPKRRGGESGETSAKKAKLISSPKITSPSENIILNGSIEKIVTIFDTYVASAVVVMEPPQPEPAAARKLIHQGRVQLENAIANVKMAAQAVERRWLSQEKTIAFLRDRLAAFEEDMLAAANEVEKEHDRSASKAMGVAPLEERLGEVNVDEAEVKDAVEDKGEEENSEEPSA